MAQILLLKLVYYVHLLSGDGVIDMGGQWVHGEEGNIAFKLGKENDLLMNSVVGEDKEIIFFEESGNVVDKNIADKYLAIFDEILKSTENLHNYTKSLGDYFEEEYDIFLLSLLTCIMR